MSKLNENFSLWATGYAVSRSLHVEIIAETDKAYKFKVFENPKCSFFVPKKALAFDEKIDGIVTLARWFKLDEFVNNMFNKYGNFYKR